MPKQVAIAARKTRFIVVFLGLLGLLGPSAASEMQPQRSPTLLVISAAPAVCLTPLGKRTFAVPYQAVTLLDGQVTKPMGSTIGMDGCAPHGLKALSDQRRTRSKLRRKGGG